MNELFYLILEICLKYHYQQQTTTTSILVGATHHHQKVLKSKTHSLHNTTKSSSVVVDFNPRIYKLVLLSFSIEPVELSLLDLRPLELPFIAGGLLMGV